MVVVTPAPAPETDDRPRQDAEASAPGAGLLVPQGPTTAPRRPVVPRRTWAPGPQPAGAPTPVAPTPTSAPSSPSTGVVAPPPVAPTPVSPPPPPAPAASPGVVAPPPPPAPAGPPARHARRVLRAVVLVVAALAVTAAVLVGARADTVAPAPAPVGVAAGAVTYRSAEVSWAPAPGATSYTVRVATDPALRDVVQTLVVDAPVVVSSRAGARELADAPPVRIRLDGTGVTEDTDLFVGITSVSHGIVGRAAPVLFVHTPLQAPGAPSRPTSTADTRGFTLTWQAGARATGYLVTVASDPAMTKIVQRSALVHGTSYRATVRDGARYYAQVVPYRENLRGPASAVRAVSTPLAHLGVPGAPTVRALSTSSVRVSWAAVAGATRYTVTLAASRTAEQRSVVTTTGTAVTLDGVRPAALGLRPIFYVRVVADRWGLVRHTSPSRPATVLAGTVRTPVAFTTTVATYNLLRTDFSDDAGRTWQQRFTLSGKALRGVGIAGLQETGWGKVDGKRPVSVVAKAAHLAVAKKPHSSKPCTPENQPVLYDPRTFTVARCGYRKVSAKSTTGADARYATWVELTDKRSHQSVLVVNAHLVAFTTTASGGSAAVQSARVGQARKLVALVHEQRRHGEPVILTGDYNSYPGRWTTTPLDVLAAAGYTSADLTARSSTDGQYASFHDFSGARANGDPIDHVVMNDQVVATSYRVHVTDSKKAPSDHYEVSAVLQVHRAR